MLRKQQNEFYQRVREGELADSWVVRRCEDQLISIATRARCGRECDVCWRARGMCTVQVGVSAADRDDYIRIWREFWFYSWCDQKALRKYVGSDFKGFHKVESTLNDLQLSTSWVDYILIIVYSVQISSYLFGAWSMKWYIHPGGCVIMKPPVKQEEQVQSLGWEDPLEKAMASCSSVLAWEITEEPGRLQSTGSQRVGQDWMAKTPPPPPDLIQIQGEGTIIKWRLQSICFQGWHEVCVFFFFFLNF